MPCAPSGRGFYGGRGSSGGGGGLGLFSGKGGGGGRLFGSGGGFFRRRGSDAPPVDGGKNGGVNGSSMSTNGGSDALPVDGGKNGGVNGSSMSTNGGVDPSGLREQFIMAHMRHSHSSFASGRPAEPATEVLCQESVDKYTELAKESSLDACLYEGSLYRGCVLQYGTDNSTCELYKQRLSKCRNAPPVPSHDGVNRFGGELNMAFSDLLMQMLNNVTAEQIPSNGGNASENVKATKRD